MYVDSHVKAGCMLVPLAKTGSYHPLKHPCAVRAIIMNTLTRRAVDTIDDDTAQARANRLCAEQVEVALVMQEMLGTVAAANYLHEKSISLEIAVRVLTREWERRWREPVNVAAYEAAPAMV